MAADDTTFEKPPIREEDPAFLELKQRILDSLDNPDRVHITWEEVYNLKHEDFATAPELLEEITDALLLIEQKPYGQELFRDIILNEHRVRPVDIAVDHDLPDAIPVGYLRENDSISFHPGMLDEKSRKIFKENFQRIGVDDLVITFLHEGDHAARMYGTELPKDFLELNLKIACEEEFGMNRANQYRAEIGADAREIYWRIENDIQGFTDPPTGTEDVVKLMKEKGLPQRDIDHLTEIFFVFNLRSKGCDSDITQSEAIIEAEKLLETFLEETGFERREDKEESTSQDDEIAPPADTPPLDMKEKPVER